MAEPRPSTPKPAAWWSPSSFGPLGKMGRINNEKGGPGNPRTALRMVSGRLAAHEASIGERNDYR